MVKAIRKTSRRYQELGRNERGLKPGWCSLHRPVPSFDDYVRRSQRQNLFRHCVWAERRDRDRIWPSITTHHDVWTMTCRAAVARVFGHGGTAVRPGRQMSKMGLTFVFRPAKARRCFGRGRPVPATDVPGDELWPTQPFPLKPPPWSSWISREEFTNLSREAKQRCGR